MIEKKTNTNKKNILLLITIIILGFIIRLYGINHGLSPHSLSLWGEEPVLELSFDFWKEFNFDPHMYNYPQLYLYLAFFSQAIIFLFGKIFGAYKEMADFTIQFLINPQIFYFAARLISAIFGTATIYIIYLIGKKYFNETAGLISAFFIAFSPLHVKYSHYYYPDVFVTFFILASFIPIYNIYKNGKTKDYIITGILIGLGMATKYFPVILGLEVLLAHFFFVQKNKIPLIKIINKNLILCVLFVGIFYFLGSPYSVINFNDIYKYLSNRDKTTAQKWFGFEKASDSKVIHHLTVNLPDAIGVPLIILGFFGMLFSIYKKNKEHSILILFLLTYLAMLEFGSVHFPNYMVTALPFFLIFASFILVELIQKIKLIDAYKNIILIVAIFLFSGRNIYASIKEGIYLSKTDARITGVEWIEANIPAGTRIVGTTYTPPILFYDKINEILNNPMFKTRQNIIKKNFLLRPIYQLTILPWSPQYYSLDLLKKHFDYIMIDSGIYGRHFANPEIYPVQIQFYQELDRKCILVKLIEGETSGNIPGPTIKIYKIIK